MVDREVADAASARRAGLVVGRRTAIDPLLSHDPSAPAVQRDPVNGVSCRLGDASCAGAHAARLGRAASHDSNGTARSLLRLQRHFGNRYVGQVIARAAHDGAATGDLDHVERTIDQARGGGQGLDHGVRRQMESSIGADFSRVRVHTDARADGLNHALSARAFATGQDIFFRQGEYNPGASSGRELIAHELTHVVQQNGTGLARKMSVSQPDDPHEIEADRVASAVMQRERDAGSAAAATVAGRDDDQAERAASRAPALADQHEEEKKRLP